MTEIVRADEAHSLTAQMDYARAVSTAALLPQAYRGKPADIMIAMGLGEAMGLSPAESLYRIDVIQGKPTASAELIAANVRKAGHKLRLRVDEQAMTATCTIIRADDPDYEHTVVRDRAWAQRMGLLSKDNYKKQPATMLGWRAVTACARMACPEALYGVAYTPDEMDDMPQRTAGAPSSQADRMRSALGVQPAPEAIQTEPEPLLLDPTSALAKALYARLRESGIDKAGATALYAEVTGREVESSKELTEVEARAVLRELDVTEAEVVEDQS